ncbi:MAG: L-seryl-tRNA(Sec) selenium transferase [Raoultibacter sp.]|jgi:L-seryl-tRNA(Ser) seleniumtransferase
MDVMSRNDALRAIPSVEEVLKALDNDPLIEQLPRSIITDCVRKTIEDTRKSILEGKTNSSSCKQISETARNAARSLILPSLKKVINVSGIIIHTNLGRSNLADEALEAVCSVAKNYSTLEYDPDTLSRGSRHSHCEQLICALTGAESAIAVNNNAAAVMMILSEFSAGKEAIVSRGELIEIGGSFRIPDIMQLSQAKMVEVGTTNKTHLSDYEAAITDDTALLLKVHPSNYRIKGFTEAVKAQSLRRLADTENQRRKAEYPEQRPQKNDSILVYEDLGSGALIPLECFNEYPEPTVSESLESGCDLVSFSGDKLLGGPQAGIIVGKKIFIDRLKKNSLARALRLDKMTLAALEATLRLYFDGDRVHKAIPTLAMLSLSKEELYQRSMLLHDALEKALPADCATLSVTEEIAHAGGGSLPMNEIPSYVVRIEFLKGEAQKCEEHLIRKRSTPIIPRIKKEAILCDVRTLMCEDDISEIADAFREYFVTLISTGNKEG